jgi:hypothetical protein
MSVLVFVRLPLLTLDLLTGICERSGGELSNKFISDVDVTPSYPEDLQTKMYTTNKTVLQVLSQKVVDNVKYALYQNDFMHKILFYMLYTKNK